MIKRIVLSLALLALPALASAQTVDRDTLLAPDGTLYTVETVFGDSQSISNEYLLLTAREGTSSTTMKVPGSITGGTHSSPALAYDSDGEILFIFWEQSINNGQNTSLLFTSYQKGKWGATTELDGANYHRRYNLRIAVTHKTQDYDLDGHPFFPELNVHAIWWEETGPGEWARYAMLTVEKGNVTSILVNDASDFINDSSLLPYPTGADFNAGILHYPQVFPSLAHESVDLVFGDLQTNAFRRLTVQPVVKKNPVTNLRIHIPIGVRNNRFPAPATNAAQMGSVAGAVSGDRDHLAFYSVTPAAVNYTMFRNGTWSTVHSIAVSERISADTAVNALRRLLNSD